MKYLKQVMLRILFCAEVVAFVYVCIWGTHGLKMFIQLKQENEEVLQEMQLLQTEIEGIKNDMHTWQKYHFFKEKIAREQLHLAHKDDVIYYTDKIAMKKGI